MVSKYYFYVFDLRTGGYNINNFGMEGLSQSCQCPRDASFVYEVVQIDYLYMNVLDLIYSDLVFSQTSPKS